jgi:hypothetical protein
MVGQLGTAGFSALGSYQQGMEQKDIDYANAVTERNNATQAEVVSKANAAQVERGATEAGAQARANMAASGVDANTGTPLEVMHSIAAKGELARRLTMYQGQLQAKGLQQQAAIDTAEGQAAAEAGLTQAGTTLLTAADKAANVMWPQTMASMGG